jgi:hypothetical protein
MPDETPDPAETDRIDTDDGDRSDDDGDRSAGDGPDTLPDDVVDEAERLTRLAREAVDDAEAAAYREHRSDLLAAHDYIARVREDETRDVLVLHPEEWVEDGTVYPSRIDDVDRGVEAPLSGPGEGDDWAEIDDHNRELVETVRDEHDAVHADNAAALADFAGNHYAKPVESLTEGELSEFLTEYYPRNAWPSAEQRAVVEKSVVVTFEAADERCPIEPR